MHDEPPPGPPPLTSRVFHLEADSLEKKKAFEKEKVVERENIAHKEKEEEHEEEEAPEDERAVEEIRLGRRSKTTLPDDADDAVGAVSWDSEPPDTEGIEFETWAGPVLVDPKHVGEWAPWEPSDGEALLLEARAFLRKKGAMPPDRICLLAFLADFAAKRVNGYASPELDKIVGTFPETWRASSDTGRSRNGSSRAA